MSDALDYFKAKYIGDDPYLKEKFERELASERREHLAKKERVKLIQLKTGDWIDAGLVREIRVLKAFSILRTGTDFPDRVFVSGVREKGLTIPFPSFEEACAYRDELAAIVNEARSSSS